MPPLLGQLGSRLCLFSRIGAIAGVVAGAAFDYVDRVAGVASIPNAILVAAVAALLAWVSTLVVFGIWFRYTVAQIGLSTLITTLLTTTAAVAALYGWNYGFAALIGFVIGMVVGAVLCLICRVIASERCDTRRTT